MFVPELITLSHVACSGGSLIHREIAKRYDVLALSEIGTGQLPQQDFVPLDIEYQLYLSAALSLSELENKVLERTRNALSLAKKHSKPLLIREHSHGYFFHQGNGSPAIDSDCSWFAEKLEASVTENILRIVTVRDPVDSWLSLKSNFPHEAPENFEHYCKLYLQFWAAVSAASNSKKPFVKFKYEDFVDNQQFVYEELDRLIGLQRSSTSNSSTIFTTGNSGRQDTKIINARHRRPITHGQLLEITNSPSYLKLCQELEYPVIQANRALLTKAWAHSLSQGMKAALKWFRRPL